MTGKFIEAGIDWVTATSSDEIGQANMESCWHAILEERGIKPAFQRKALWQGYVGVRVEHGFFGTRKDGCCCVLSGPLAFLHGREMMDCGGRPSRLDLQVTGLSTVQPGKAIEQMFNVCKTFKPATGHPPSLKMWVGREGPEGLYVGSRSSEIMLRIYDKGRESRELRYSGWLRIEAELKNASAQRYAGALLHSESTADFTRGAVKGLCEARGVPIPFEIGGAGLLLRPVSPPTTIESKAAWLAKQVSPTVQAMAEEIGWARVASLLFPDSMDKHTAP